MSKLRHCGWPDHPGPRMIPAENFHLSTRDGYQAICKACCVLRSRKYRATSNVPRIIDMRRYKNNPRRRARNLEYADKNREFTRAVKRCIQRVQDALERGLLAKPSRCQNPDCPSPAGSFLEAAHHDYSSPLDVTWLCRRCHRTWDYYQPKGGSLRENT